MIIGLQAKKTTLKVIALIFGGVIGVIPLTTLINLVLGSGTILLPIPSAERFGHKYLEAVIQKNQSYIGEGNLCTHTRLLEHITKYGGAEVQNVLVSAMRQSSNSDHEFEITTIEFKYHDVPGESWTQGEILLMTASNLFDNSSSGSFLPVRRIICAGAGLP